MAMITFAINYISVSVNTIITNLAPIYMAFLAFVVLKENITKIEIFITFLGFFGVYLISLDKPSDPVDRSNYLLGITINIVASVFMACGYICLRKINTTESPLYSPFYFFSGATLFAFC
jgi:drug/metabolite transporter (DMT)-like permease